ncbi:4'-phosphopantetheinyl transferase superfamily protein [Streptomyces sp. NPDC006552]|uniref:4'-phosphopantetheinyl transferase family protein n=1 Tax=Streptomyces sp. NPDC006552 TaxID=3157179 RepID=UPI0033B40FB1
MIEHILPLGVAVTEAFHDSPASDLFPQEARLVEQAVAARRREFATVRRCAREALARLGLPPVSILPDRHGAPRWPAAVLGSLTHCAGYRAAVVAPAAELRLLGIDAEPDAPLPPGVLESIALPSELRLVRHLLTRRPQVRWDRALFSMKEAVYKSWYPHTGQRLEFEDAELAFDADSPVFTARLRLPAAPELEGRWMADKGLLITAIAA